MAVMPSTDVSCIQHVGYIESPVHEPFARQHASSAPDAPYTIKDTTAIAKGEWICNVEGCRAGPYKRRGDLRRHSIKHNVWYRFGCPAVGCSRTGHREFTRMDKLIDHILAGHDEDAIFSCSKCGEELPRDLLTIRESYQDLVIGYKQYRTCPMLRCSFKIHIGWCKNDRLERL
jgi:hypothetical protein